MPVFPLVGSTIVVCSSIRPACSAASIMLSPMRSFTLEQGLNDSSLATSSVSSPAPIFFNRTSGVFPTSLVMSSAILVISGLPLFAGDGRSRGRTSCSGRFGETPVPFPHR